MHVRATDGVYVAWFGCHTVTDDESIEFAFSGVSFAVRVTGAQSVYVDMRGGHGRFRVRKRNLRTGISCDETICAGNKMDRIQIASELDSAYDYEILVVKLSEVEVRSIFTSFYPALVRGVYVDHGHFVSIDTKKTFYPRGWIEAIGDSDACGFGVAGPPTSTWNFLSMDPTAQSVLSAWGCKVAEMMGLGELAVRTIAGSGKGITKNAIFCGGKTLPLLWREANLYAISSRLTEAPQAVIVLGGGNDFFNFGRPNEAEFVQRFKEFLGDLHELYGSAVPIYVFQCSASCSSSGGSPLIHPMDDPEVLLTSALLIEFTRRAVNEAVVEFGRMFRFEVLDVKLDLLSDFGTMMHWNRSGQHKIALSMLNFIIPQNAQTSSVQGARFVP